MASVRIGTSGYVYKHWRSIFYPAGLPASRWFEFYAQRFDTVELNATFYRLPSVDAAVAWRQSAPRGFLFACKGSRYLTHLKRLLDTTTGLQRFFEPVRRLGAKLGPILWQLPPQMVKADVPRLEGFLARLPPSLRHVFEFRSLAWYTDEVCDVLDRHGAAICEHDLLPDRPPRVTGGFRYLRFHGNGARYSGRYGALLEGVAADLEEWQSAGRDAYVYFNNDIHGHAVEDAALLKRHLGQATSPQPE